METAMVIAHHGEASACMTHRILCVVGTRPEAIKMAPVIQALRRKPGLGVRVLATAQHREMLDETLAQFGIVPDIDLDIMRPDQTLADLTARLLAGIDAALVSERPDVVVAQGDTTTVFASALASFYRRIPFGHVEAGLRTGDFSNPFPEEMNRCFSGRLAALHFAPTAGARANLLREGIPDHMIHVTGNTVIDAVQWMAENKPDHGLPIDGAAQVILLTCHRRENFGNPLRQILSGVRRLAAKHPEVMIVYPVHPNPGVAGMAHQLLAGIPNIVLTEPLSYARLVAVMKACQFVLTDSGGLQEEAPALGKPVLVLRNETERPEAVEAGIAILVGQEEETVVREASRLLDDKLHYQAMARTVSPYGDGHAGERIAEIITSWLKPKE
jgi:UDP-N-acetylglucosamine 2-epimerase (non-hydrolysing)